MQSLHVAGDFSDAILRVSDLVDKYWNGSKSLLKNIRFKSQYKAPHLFDVYLLFETNLMSVFIYRPVGESSGWRPTEWVWRTERDEHGVNQRQSRIRNLATQTPTRQISQGKRTSQGKTLPGDVTTSRLVTLIPLTFLRSLLTGCWRHAKCWWRRREQTTSRLCSSAERCSEWFLQPIPNYELKLHSCACLCCQVACLLY